MNRKNSNNLKELRQALGMSQYKLAEEVGVARDTVRLWEQGVSFPQSRFKGKLSDIFNGELTFGPPSDTEDKPPVRTKKFYDMEEHAIQAVVKNRTIARFFAVGKCYNISDSANSSEHSPIQQSILRYERKEGIHHVFREVRGKWIVTYTDAQLVGKYVKEIDENGNSLA